MNLTEDVIGILGYSIRQHDINSSSTSELYSVDLSISGDNLLINIIKRGTQANTSWLTVLDTGDQFDVVISFLTSS